jgi:hypothetical protein
LPVPADLLVYTVEEWHAMARERGRFWRTVDEEGVWVHRRDESSSDEA